MQGTRSWFVLGTAGLVVFVSLGVARASDDVRSLVQRIKQVGGEGAGNLAASRASRELAARGPDILIELLGAMDDADPRARNWLRAAVDTIAERSLARGKPLPAAGLEQFLLDRRHAGPVRQLAFDWLRKVDATAPGRLIPGMIDDPSVELRREAVAREAKRAATLLGTDDLGAKNAFQQVLASARDHDQVMDIAKQLETLGVQVNLTEHFGCVQQWQLIAPFDNSEKSGFDRAFPPELNVDLGAEYDGKTNDESKAKVKWIAHTTADPFGVVDLNKAIGKHMGAVAYAVAQVESDGPRPIRIHAGSPNAIKIWLNGKLVYSRDEYHHGMSMDQYQATGTLRAGTNTILIKVCQNEQKEDWAQNWTFQLRVCDLTGAGL